MTDEATESETMHATKQEIQEYEEEHNEPHPVFRVNHRPERITFDIENNDEEQESETEQ